VSWKDNIQVRDLDPQDRIELTCHICKKTRYLTGAELQQRPAAHRLYLAEVEQRAKCRQRGCGGTMRLAMPHIGETKGFVGGMA